MPSLRPAVSKQATYRRRLDNNMITQCYALRVAKGTFK
jgi:hypothetical protein